MNCFSNSLCAFHLHVSSWVKIWVPLSEVFSSARVPYQLARYFHHTCKLETMDHFLSYVVRKDFETALRVIVAEAIQRCAS